VDTTLVREKFGLLIEDALMTRMQDFANRQDISITALDCHVDGEEMWRQSEWVVLIVVYAAYLRLQFKVFFSHEAIEPFLKHNRDLGDRAQEQKIRVDFIKEYCNLVGGRIKSILEEIEQRDQHFMVPPREISRNERCAASLVRMENKGEGLNFYYQWNIEAERAVITITSHANISDSSKASNLSKINLAAFLVTKEGVVEFF
jgi:hypothetical protein